MWSTQFISKTRLALDIWEFRFTRPKGYDYTPGQYATFSFHEPLNDPRGQARVMSFTSHPTDDCLAFVTRISGQPSPFKSRLSSLQAGESLVLDMALGDLVLPRSTEIPLVFVAGGIGIASFVSMLRDIEKTGETRKIHLLYALRSDEERLFSDLLGRFPFTSKQEFISPNRLRVEDILAAADTDDALFYLSGTESFVENLRKDLLVAGLSDTQVIFDYFTGYN